MWGGGRQSRGISVLGTLQLSFPARYNGERHRIQGGATVEGIESGRAKCYPIEDGAFCVQSKVATPELQKLYDAARLGTHRLRDEIKDGIWNCLPGNVVLAEPILLAHGGWYIL